MNARPGSSTARRERAARRGLRAPVAMRAASLALAMAAAGFGSWCAPALGDEPASGPMSSAGTWQNHRYSFQFMGFTSTYSCDGLADKLKVLLLAAGARPDVRSQPGACASPFGTPDKFARADLTFWTLAPIRDGEVPAADDRPARGAWRAVAFAAASPRELRSGDCELVEQFRTQLLPMFTARNVSTHTTCIPFQESGSTIDLKFEAFAAARRAKGSP